VTAAQHIGVAAPSSNDTVTTCGNCGSAFPPIGRQAWCSPACRVAAWRRRHSTFAVPPPLPPKGRRRTVTVYEYDSCGDRALGSQRYDACNRWMRSVGIGGRCPACEAPLAATELIQDV
jgi:predicted amidophosphoribosyltransferase